MDLLEAKELANAHWSYVNAVLVAHNQSNSVIEVAKMHYISAFVHGWKHAMETKNACTVGDDNSLPSQRDFYYSFGVVG